MNKRYMEDGYQQENGMNDREIRKEERNIERDDREEGRKIRRDER